jgi:4-amino-4-deoxy-L-arabinose transferase-like glycosyltransferase
MLLLTTMVVLEVASMRHLTVTYDEPRHFLYGQNILKLDSTRFDDSKMPISALNALPGALAARWPGAPAPEWLGRVETARLVTVAFSLLVGLCVFAWARERSGPYGGLLALALYAFDPNFLAHGQLVTTDVYAAGTIVMALFAFWRLLGLGGWRPLVATGIALGLALVSKYTSLALVPLFAIVALLVHAREIRDALRERAHRALWRRLRVAIGRAAVVGGLALGMVNAAFLFNGTGTSLSQYAFRSSPFQWMQRHASWVGQIPLPVPYPYIEGLDWVVQRERTGEGYGNIYLLGEARKGEGFAGYYLVATLFKVPLATTALLIVAAIVYLRRLRAQGQSPLDWVMVVPVAFFTVYFNFFYQAQIGMRYFLVVFPPLYVLAGDLVGRAPGPSRRTVGAVLTAVAALAGSVLSYYPHFLPYFNELIGDRRQAYRILADSNLDWGQHVWYFQRYMAAHPESVVEPERPTAGTILVGVNMLTGVAGEPERFRWLRDNFTPVDHIAHAVLVYQVSEEELERVKDTKAP